MLPIWLIFCLGIFQARAASMSRSSPFFESDYLQLVKDIPEFKIGRSYGLWRHRQLILLGPNAFPVITKNKKDGYAYVAAGRYGKVVIMAKKEIDLMMN